MYVNQHRASSLRNKHQMKKAWGKPTPGAVHSLISRKIYDQHENDFKNYRRVACIWLCENFALIGYK